VNHQQVSTFLTAGNVKLMLLHTGKSEDGIRNFFQDVYELYVKVRCGVVCSLPYNFGRELLLAFGSEPLQSSPYALPPIPTPSSS